MNFFRATVNYIFKNFVYLILFALIPALFFAYSFDKPTVQTLLHNFFTGNPHASFTEIFRSVSILNFRSLSALLTEIAGVVLMVLCMSMLTAFTEKHMRIGKRTFNGLFARVNDNLLSTFYMTFLYGLLYELWALICSSLLVLVSLAKNTALVYVLAGVVWFGTEFVLLYLVAVFYTWLPCMQITGFRSFEALRYSYQLSSPVKRKILFSQFLNLTFSVVLLAVVALFVPGKIVSFVVATVIYAFLIMFFVVRMEVVYFDRAGLERADLKKYYLSR